MRVDVVPELGDRTTYLGASDIATVLGLDDHRTPQDVWRQKTGQAGEFADTEDTIRGHLMEPVIESLVASIDGVKLWPCGALAVVGTPIRVHPDRIDDANRIHELKAPRRFSAQWGKPDTDEVPQRYLVQVLAQQWALLRCGGTERTAYLHAMAGERRRYVIPYAEDTANAIMDHVLAWWDAHVIAQREPPPASMQELNRIARRRAQVVVGADVVERVRQLAWLRKVETKAKDMGDEVKRGLLALLVAEDGSLPESIGDGEGNVIATTRRGSRKRLDPKKLTTAYPDVARECETSDEWNELRPAKGLPLVQAPEILAIGEGDE